MMKMTKDSHMQFVKACFKGALPLGLFFKTKSKIQEIYKEDQKDICALPEDIATLALSNDCAIGSYVDFHQDEKSSNLKKSYSFLSKKLDKLF